MIPAEDRSNAIADAAIDRLVDGDLTEAERRALLLRLENDPEGWRRFALAFLEDQAWRRPSPDRRPGRDGRRSSPLAPGPAGRAWIAGIDRGFSARRDLRGGLRRRRGEGRAARASRSPRPTRPSPIEAPGRPDRREIREVGSFDLVDGSPGRRPPDRVPILSGPGLDDMAQESTALGPRVSPGPLGTAGISGRGASQGDVGRTRGRPARFDPRG